MAPVEFANAVEAYQTRENNQFRADMEVARFLATHIWNSSGRTLKKNEFNPRKLIPFEDDPVEKKQQSVEEMKSIMMGITKTQNLREEQKEKRKKHKK